MTRTARTLAFASLIAAVVALIACDGNLCLIGCDGGQVALTGSSAVPSPSVTPPGATPTPKPTATPADPCNPVIRVQLQGPLTVPVTTTFQVDVTPWSPSGPLEKTLDYCNVAHFVALESVSTNLRCVGNCSGYGPQFIAQGVGPFAISIRVEGVTGTISGTVTK